MPKKREEKTHALIFLYASNDRENRYLYKYSKLNKENNQKTIHQEQTDNLFILDQTKITRVRMIFHSLV